MITYYPNNRTITLKKPRSNKSVLNQERYYSTKPTVCKF